VTGRRFQILLPTPDYRTRGSWTAARHDVIRLTRDYKVVVRRAIAEAGVPNPYFGDSFCQIDIRRRYLRHNINPEHDRAWVQPILDCLGYSQTTRFNPNGHVCVWLPTSQIRTEVTTTPRAGNPPTIVVTVIEEKAPML
jgi:hypothetical protein